MVSKRSAIAWKGITMGKSETAVRNNVPANHQQLSVMIVVPLTRKWAIDMLAKQFAALDHDGLKVDMLIYIDTDTISHRDVHDAFEKYETTIPYRTTRSGRFAPQEVRVFARRDRIRDMLTSVQVQVRKYDSQHDLMFMVEDDTMIERNTLQRLVNDYNELTKQGVKVGFIEGAQVGRHGIRMIGAWRMNDLENPTEMSTIPFNSTALFEKIDGGGLYCFITPMHLFLDHVFYWTAECFSVDVTYGIELRKKGYTNIIDWSVVAGHADQHGKVLVPNENCTIAAYKLADNGIWELQPFKKGEQIS